MCRREVNYPSCRALQFHYRIWLIRSRSETPVQLQKPSGVLIAGLGVDVFGPASRGQCRLEMFGVHSFLTSLRQASLVPFGPCTLMNRGLVARPVRTKRCIRSALLSGVSLDLSCRILPPQNNVSNDEQKKIAALVSFDLETRGQKPSSARP